MQASDRQAGNSTIDICIATYRRPQMLTNLLRVVATELMIPEEVKLEIIVADNDAELSAQSIVKNAANQSVIPIQYVVEPEKNIAKVRNRAIDTSRADYVVFIDDDEYPDKYWLIHMWNAVQQFKADIVFGPVLPVFSESCPKWVKRGGFFERIRYPTGMKMGTGATNNVIISRTFLKEQCLGFNEKYGRTGGSDTHLFLITAKSGANQIWCNEALVYEEVLENRTTIEWLIKRAYRSGQVAGRLLVSTLTTPGKLHWGMKRLVFITFTLLSLPVAVLLGRPVFVKVMQKAAANIGHITALTGRYYEEYGVNR
jgi:succinoglycan biosynthesis protein ExoM